MFETSHFFLSSSLSFTSARTSTTTPTTTSTFRATSWASRSSAETSCTSSTARTRTGGRPTETASGPRRSQVFRADYKFPPLSMRAATPLNTISRSLSRRRRNCIWSVARSLSPIHPSMPLQFVVNSFRLRIHPRTVPFPSLPSLLPCSVTSSEKLKTIEWNGTIEAVKSAFRTADG